MPLLLIIALGAAVYFYARAQATAQQVSVQQEIVGLGVTLQQGAQQVSQIVTSIPVVGQLFVSNAVIKKLAVAIATAEGYYVSGSRPQRNNNPGDLKGNYAHTAVAIDSDGFDVYGSVQDGWNALYRQILLWLTNKSSVAGEQTTIAELSQRYTTTDQLSWASNVANSLGVSQDTKLGEIV